MLERKSKVSVSCALFVRMSQQKRGKDVSERGLAQMQQCLDIHCSLSSVQAQLRAIDDCSPFANAYLQDDEWISAIGSIYLLNEAKRIGRSPYKNIVDQLKFFMLVLMI